MSGGKAVRAGKRGDGAGRSSRRQHGPAFYACLGLDGLGPRVPIRKKRSGRDHAHLRKPVLHGCDLYLVTNLCHNGAMMAPISRTLERINLRLPKALFAAIDAARGNRPGKVSRNTWIAEAVQEKLAREGAANDLKTWERAENG